MATKRNPAMALIEAIQFLLGEVATFDSDPSKVQRASALKAEIAELETYEIDFGAAEQERVDFFAEQEAKGVQVDKGSLISGAIDDMKRAIEGSKASPAATNDPAAGK